MRRSDFMTVLRRLFPDGTILGVNTYITFRKGNEQDSRPASALEMGRDFVTRKLDKGTKISVPIANARHAMRAMVSSFWIIVAFSHSLVPHKNATDEQITEFERLRTRLDVNIWKTCLNCLRALEQSLLSTDDDLRGGNFNTALRQVQNVIDRQVEEYVKYRVAGGDAAMNVLSELARLLTTGKRKVRALWFSGGTLEEPAAAGMRLLRDAVLNPNEMLTDDIVDILAQKLVASTPGLGDKTVAKVLEDAREERQKRAERAARRAEQRAEAQAAADAARSAEQQPADEKPAKKRKAKAKRKAGKPKAGQAAASEPTPTDAAPAAEEGGGDTFGDTDTSAALGLEPGTTDNGIKVTDKRNKRAAAQA